MPQYDVAVVGGGLVGASCALALAGSRFKVALLEGRPPVEPEQADWDARIYAISPANRRFLSELGVWRLMEAERLTSVQCMRVRGDRHDALLEFNAHQVQEDELATILENRQLQWALWRALRQAPNVEIISPAGPASVSWSDDMASLALTDGRQLDARLVVGADGANSWVRAQAGIAAEPKPYRQKGVVANFVTEKPHGNVARQWFFEDGILAWLPLPGNRISIVWSTWNDKADELCALPDAELAQQVAAAGMNELGELRVMTSAVAFPLRLLQLKQITKPRLALIGDAAHNVHPLAGQGVNLGFQDARVLAEMLRQAPAAADPGDYGRLRRFERARAEDVLAMQLLTDGLQRLFNNTNPLLAGLRNFGLSMTNQLGPIKNLLIRHALG